MTLKLHCMGESGNAYKAALALELSGLDWEPVYVDFFGGQTRTKEWRSDLNLIGEVPVLDTGSQKLTQSGVIQAWISKQTGKFCGREGEELEVLRWVLFDNHKMSSQAGVLRFLMNFLPEEKRPQEVIPWLAGRLKAALEVLDAHLEGRDWIVGDGLTNADISNCGYLFYPEPFTFQRSDWPNIDRWLSNVESTPGWKHPYDLMPGHPSDRGL